MEDNKKVNPCDFCLNSKHDVIVGKCYELACIGYSRFQAAPTTPKEVLEEVEAIHEGYAW